MDAGDFEPPAPTLTARANTTVSHKWLFSAHVQHGCRDRLGLAVKKKPDLQGKRKKIQTKPHTCFKAGLKPPFIEKKSWFAMQGPVPLSARNTTAVGNLQVKIHF